FVLRRRPPRSTRFPYTTLFRSRRGSIGADRPRGRARLLRGRRHPHDRRERGRGRLGGQGLLQGRVSAEPSDVRLSQADRGGGGRDRKSTRLNSSHVKISYAVFC